MSRSLRPRETDAITVAPVLVSDRTAPALVGLEPRAFRELVRSLGIPHVVQGKRILVRARDLELAIEVRAGETHAPEIADAGDAEGDGAEPTKEEILARVAGRR